MKVSEVMTKDAECIRPEATVQEAAARMKSLDIGPLPVCEKDRLVGMLTDRDITVRATAKGKEPTEARVRDVMSEGIVYCFEDQDVEEAARIMQEQQIRRLPVLNREKRLVGIVSLGDLAVDAGDEQLTGKTLEAVSEPSRPKRPV